MGSIYEERNILAPGRSKQVHHPSALFFLYSVHVQKVVLVPKARIFLAERQEDPSTM